MRIRRAYTCLAVLLAIISPAQTFRECHTDQLVVTSPGEGKAHPAGQDLVLAYSSPPCLEQAGKGACRLIVLINDRLEVSQMNRNPELQRLGCWGTAVVDKDKLSIGHNTMHFMILRASRSGEEEEEEEVAMELTVNFTVEARNPWVPHSAETCDFTQHAGDGGCLHEVNNKCIVRDLPPANGSLIPRILHWVWVGGGGGIPERFHGYMQSFRDRHPGWQHIVWTDDLVTWELRNAALVRQADSYAGR